MVPTRERDEDQGLRVDCSVSLVAGHWNSAVLSLSQQVGPLPPAAPPDGDGTDLEGPIG